MVIFRVILFFNILISYGFAHDNNLEQYLSGRIPAEDKRYNSFLYALQLMHDCDAKTLLETGTSRDGDTNFTGDGGATIIFGQYAKETGGLLYTVDISPEAIAAAQQATQLYADHINYVVSDSLLFLADFNGYIDFLYLDSYDYDWENPGPSQNHHLQEIILALPHLHDNSIVMIDDCQLPGGGKGLLVIEYLKRRGWVVVYDGYQTIMRKSSL